MAEILTRTQTIEIEQLILNWAGEKITVTVRETGRESRSIVVEGVDAVTAMRQLNTADLSANSLHRRVLTFLINRGELDGTISGTPDVP